MDYGMGVAIQWITRGNDKLPVKVRELVAFAAIVAGASLTVWLSPAFKDVHSVRDFVLAMVPKIGQIATGVLGTSMAANGAVAAGANPEHILVPITQTN